MAKVDPDKTRIVEGQIIVRVGADAEACPNGAAHHMYPVVQLIWPDTEEHPTPNGNLTLRWQDKLDTDKPSKSATPKYLGLVTDTGDQWVGYRVSDKDRELFERLRKKWGMWFLRVRRQSEEKDLWWTFFNDGSHFPGALITRIMDVLEEKTAAELRDDLHAAWATTVNFLKEKAPHWIPEESRMKIQIERILRIPSLLEELGGGPLPWKKKELPHWGKPDNKAHEFVVSQYLMVLRALQRNSLNKRVPEKFQHECAKMYDMLRTAKIFEITPESYVEMHLAVDRHVTEDIAHLTFHDPRDAKVEVPEGEGTLLYKRQMEACEKLPFPDKMPFDACWFALTGVVAISDLQAETRSLSLGEGPYTLCGILATSDGEHHELLISQKYEDYGNDIAIRMHITTHHVEEEQAWQHVLCMAPFVLHFLVDAINEHQTTIISQRKLGMQSQSKLRKGLGDLGLKKSVPPPFYTVYLRDKVIKEIAKGYSGGKLRAKPSHRFDVRGHWCFKIYRGVMPMDVELELHLDNLKYSIYKNRPVDEWVKEALRERDMALPQEGEWIAVKRYWKNSYVKGPDGAQYVPSTRRATKGVLAFDNEAASGNNTDVEVA
jgi:hypothetical protein